jgi:hypothetical protein
VTPLHADLESLRPLLGTWTGQGSGEYPTIDDFEYGESIVISHIGKPFLAYQQRTWRLADHVPLHSESGYWRVPAAGRVELVLAHPTGVVEVYEGRLKTEAGGHATVIEMATSLVGLTTSAKQVDSLRRTFTVDGDTLTYDVDMAAVGVGLTHHLSAALHRSTGG